MAEPIRLPDTPAPFRAWLESLPGEQVVGKRNRACSCPLVEYLKFLGGVQPIVSKYSYAANYSAHGPVREELPEWACEFRTGVDCGGESDSDITAAECLAILEGLPHG